jgi:hypothetical protein
MKKLTLAVALVSLLAFPGCVLFSLGVEDGLIGLFCSEAKVKVGACACFVLCRTNDEGLVTQCFVGDAIFEECYGGPPGEIGLAGAPVSARFPRGAGPTFAVPDDAYFALGSYAAGAATSHQIGLTVGPNAYETFSATAVYPPEFAFAGFAPGTVGRLQIDFDLDGADDVAVPVLGLGGDAAFADVDANGLPGAFEPTVVHSGGHAFAVTLLEGGDANPRTLVTRAPLRLTLTLVPGVLANPPLAGVYALQLDATSVDPDTGDADDAAGDPPLALTRTEEVTIGEGTCPAAPALGCNATFERAALALKDSSGDGDLLKIKAKRGRTAPGFFGDPTLETSHATCFYDARGLLLELPIAAGGTGANGKPLWKKRGERAGYRDAAAAAGGVRKVGQRSGRKGASFDVQARGAALALPELPLQPPVVVQQRTQDGACAEATFDTLTRNDATQAKGSAR